MVSSFVRNMIRILRALIVKHTRKEIDVLGRFVEKNGGPSFCFSHLPADLTNKGPFDGHFMMILNTKGVILTRDQAEEDNGSFAPVWKTSV